MDSPQHARPLQVKSPAGDHVQHRDHVITRAEAVLQVQRIRTRQIEQHAVAAGDGDDSEGGDDGGCIHAGAG